MYKRFLPLLIFFACAVLASCDASFTVPNPVNPNAIPLLDTKTNAYPMTGYVISSSQRCDDSLPAGARIIVAWEKANTAQNQKEFYVYGTGIVNKDTSTIPWGFPWQTGYKFNVIVDSNLPKVVLWPNADSANVIAVGHLFLTTNQFLRNGDTILYTDFRASDDILGGVYMTAVVYLQGNQKLFGKPLDQSQSHQGFNFLQEQFNGRIRAIDSSKVILNIGDDRDQTEHSNPFWLLP